MRLRSISTLAIATLFLLSCGGDGPDKPIDPTPETPVEEPENPDEKNEDDPGIDVGGGVIVSSNTIILDDSIADKIVEINDDYMIVKDLGLGIDFSPSTKADGQGGNACYAETEKGSFFICKPNDKAPRGFFGKVASIEPFQYGASFGYKINWWQGDDYSLTDVILAGAGGGCSRAYDIDSYEESPDITYDGTDWSLKLSGKTESGMTISGSLKCSNSFVPDMHFSFDHGNVQAKIGAIITSELTLNIDATLQAKKAIKLGKIKPLHLFSKPFVFMVGGFPLVITTDIIIEPELSFYGKLSVSGDMVKWTHNKSVGFYIPADKEEGNLYFSCFDNDGVSLFDDAKVSLDGGVKLSAPIKLRFYFYNWSNCNGAIGLEPYAKLNQNLLSASPDTGYLWGNIDYLYLKFGADLFAEASFAVLKRDWARKTFKWSYNLVEATKPFELQTQRARVHTLSPGVKINGVQLSAVAAPRADDDKITEWGFGYYAYDPAEDSDSKDEFEVKNGSGQEDITFVKVPTNNWSTPVDVQFRDLLQYSYFLESLEPNKDYKAFSYVRTKDHGVAYGETVTFKAPDMKNSASVTIGYPDTQSTYAKVSVFVKTEFDIKEVGIVVSETNSDPVLGLPDCRNFVASSQTTDGGHQVHIDGLKAGTMYRIKGYAIVNDGGEDAVFYSDMLFFSTSEGGSGGIIDVPGEDL